MAERVAIVGNLGLDHPAGAGPRAGGVVVYGPRALALAGADAVVVARCAAEHRDVLFPSVEASGLPAEWREASSTVSFAYAYEGERRTMEVAALGEPWTPADVEAVTPLLGGVTWVVAGSLLRGDFPGETLAALARGGRRVVLTGHGLARARRVGPLERDGALDVEALEHVTAVVLSEGEAEAIGLDLGALEVIRVPEVVVTLGTRGCAVVAYGTARHVPATPVETGDPTGAGDMFAAGYAAARAAGHPPADAAAAASELVARALAA